MRLLMRAVLLAALAALPAAAGAQALACQSGQAAVKQRLFATAVSLLTKCLEAESLAPRQRAAVLQMRALAFSSTGGHLRASEDYKASLELKPADVAWDLIPLGVYLRDAGEHRQSLAVLERAATLDEDGPGTGPGMAVFFHLGWTLHELRRYPEAVEAYTKGIGRQPDFEGGYFRRALALEASGDRARAKLDLEKVLDLGRGRGLDPATAPEEFRAKFREYGLIAR